MKELTYEEFLNIITSIRKNTDRIIIIKERIDPDDIRNINFIINIKGNWT